MVTITRVADGHEPWPRQSYVFRVSTTSGVCVCAAQASCSVAPLHCVQIRGLSAAVDLGNFRLVAVDENGGAPRRGDWSVPLHGHALPLTYRFARALCHTRVVGASLDALGPVFPAGSAEGPVTWSSRPGREFCVDDLQPFDQRGHVFACSSGRGNMLCASWPQNSWFRSGWRGNGAGRGGRVHLPVTLISQCKVYFSGEIGCAQQF